MFTFMGLSDLTLIAIIACVACLIFGGVMLITKKPGIVRSIRDKASYKDSTMYSIKGGKMILALGAACFVMILLSLFVNEMVANVFGIVCLIVFGYFWKKMSDEFGPV